MKHYIFLGRTKDEGICYYIQDKPAEFECGHYFSTPYLTNANCLIHDFPEYKNLETILSHDEYDRFLELKNDIDSLGFGIRIGDERYTKGLVLRKSLLDDVYDKLTSTEAAEFFGNIVKDEKRKLVDFYELTDYQINQIFDNYPLDYRDANIVATIYDDDSEIAEEFIDNFYFNIDDIPGFKLSYYIDYDKLGHDLVLDSDKYLELDDDRVIEYAL